MTKRQLPAESELDWRQEYLRQVRTRPFERAYDKAPLLEPGNSKIGTSSELYDRVLVWNIPVVVTCPGASNWCLRHCYNADPRDNKFPIDRWNENLQYYLQDREGLKGRLLETLIDGTDKQAVRLHSSGDFFEVEYVRFWRDIVEETPAVKYWAYTRSWNHNKLLDSLDQLRIIENIQLFASWDFSMPSPPAGWRKSIVYSADGLADQQPGLICPEQSGLIPNCATCDYCISKGHGDVNFILH